MASLISLRHNLRRLRSTPPREIFFVFRIAALLLCTDVCLRLFPLALVRRVVHGCRGEHSSSDTSIPRLASAVAFAGRCVRARCLARALVLERLLACRGIPSEVWVGVQRDGGQLRAHAWLEHQRLPIIGGELRHAYTPLAVVDAPPRGRS
jgi:Transglutaminase-like superfamily